MKHYRTLNNRYTRRMMNESTMEERRYRRMRRLNEVEEASNEQYNEIQFMIADVIHSFEDAEYLKKFIIDLGDKNNFFKIWLQSHAAGSQTSLTFDSIKL